jgi:hypothetical protein
MEWGADSDFPLRTSKSCSLREGAKRKSGNGGSRSRVQVAASREVSLRSVTIEGDVWRRLVKVLEPLDTEEARALLRDLMK